MLIASIMCARSDSLSRRCLRHSARKESMTVRALSPEPVSPISTRLDESRWEGERTGPEHGKDRSWLDTPEARGCACTVRTMRRRGWVRRVLGR